MKKSNLVYGLIGCLVFILIGIGVFVVFNFSPNQGEDRQTNQSEEFKPESALDLVERGNQYSLLETINLTNSLIPECDWGGISFPWDFPNQTTAPVYQTSFTRLYLDGLGDDEEKETYTSENEALEMFFAQQNELTALLEYDYSPVITDSAINASVKVPLYANVNGLTVLTTEVGIWRDEDGKYVAGLYEASDGYNYYQIDPENPWMSIPLLLENDVKELIISNNISFLNHVYDCEEENVSMKEIIEIDIVYLRVNNDSVLFPVYRINGILERGSRDINFTALVNSVNYEELDYSGYYNSTEDIIFLPRSYISSVNKDGADYNVAGFFAGTMNIDGIEYKAENTNISIIVTEETGEYVYSSRKDRLLEEIEESLGVKDNTFSFSFSQANFWKVETLFYEDEDGNELDEPVHRGEDEQNRFEYDNNFGIQICSDFNGVKFCSSYSNIVLLPPFDG